MRFSHFVFISSMCISALSHADDELVQPEDLGQPISAVAHLKSLSDIQEQTFQVPTIHALNNRHGVSSTFVQVNDLPMVDIQLMFDAGAVRDREIDPELSGIAHMTAQLMSKGTDQYSAAQISRYFEDLGAKYTIQAQRDSFTVTLRVLSEPKKIDAAVNMLLHIINHASFARPNMTQMVQSNQQGQKQLQENASRLIQLQFYRSVYGQHPYASSTTGTAKSIAKIQTQHLQQFRQQYLVRENLNIAITGKLSKRSANALANSISQHIPSGQKAKALAAAQDTQKWNIHHIHQNASQAHVMMGHLTTSRHDPDRLALEVANRMLGNSSFNSLLMQELRIKRGYTYGVSSALSFPKSTGMFSISYSTEQAQLLDSIQVAHQTLIRFLTQPIDAALLQETKSGMLKAFPLNFASNASINGQIATLGFHQEPLGYLANYRAQVEKLSAADVEAAVRRHLRANQLTVVVVSNQLDKSALQHMLEANFTATSADQVP